MNNKKNDIKNIIHLYMARMECTPEEMAKAIGVSRATFFNKMREPSNWRIDELLRAYEYLRVPDCERYSF